LIRKIQPYSVTVTSSQSQHVNVNVSSTKSLRHSIHRFQKQQSVERIVRLKTSSCSRNLCRCTKQSLDHCRTWQSGTALWEKNEILGRQAIHK